MKMYVWIDDDEKYCYGIYCVLAENIKQARELVKKTAISVTLRESTPKVYRKPAAVYLVKG
jgi:hypothetical protein